MSDTIISLESALDQFRDAIAAKGITPPIAIEPDGKLHRFSSNGKPDDDAGWYVFHEGNIPAGSFGDFRTGQTVSSWMADIGRPLLPLEKKDFRKKQEEMRVKREADIAIRRAEAKQKASNILRLSEAAHDDHPYLLRKEVRAHGLRNWKGLLIIPMIDESCEVQSLQFIAGDAGKRFLSGGKMQGCYFPLGDLNEAEIILIAEGYATAATLYEVTGQPTIVAYNAGNLLPVARSIRAQHPAASIIICADDDNKTKGNPGLTKAHEAARAINGTLIAPDFGDNRPDGLTDFNDMAVHLGKEAVACHFINRPVERKIDTTYSTATTPQTKRLTVRLDA